MAEYRTIRMTFWNDPFVEDLSAAEKLLYLYLFTSPQTNNLGVLEVSRKRIAFESGLSVDEVRQGLDKLREAGKLIVDGNFLFLTRFIKNQTTTSPKIIDSLKGMYAEISSEKIRHEICLLYPHIFDGCEQPQIPHDNPMDTVSKPYQNPTGTVSIPHDEFKGSAEEQEKHVHEDRMEPDSPKNEKNGEEIPHEYPTDTVSIPYPYPTDTVSIPYANGMDGVCIGSRAREREFKREEEIKRGSLKREESEKEETAALARLPPSPKGKKPEESKLTFGEFKRVRLTQREYDRLCEKYGKTQTDEAVTFLDLHIASKGKDPYRDHCAALQKWVYDAVAKQQAERRATQNPRPFVQPRREYVSDTEARQRHNDEVCRQVAEELDAAGGPF